MPKLNTPYSISRSTGKGQDDASPAEKVQDHSKKNDVSPTDIKRTYSLGSGTPSKKQLDKPTPSKGFKHQTGATADGTEDKTSRKPLIISFS